MATLAELAALSGAELVGGGGREIARVAALEDAGPGDLSILLDRKFLPEARASRASALLTSRPLMEELGRPDLAYLLAPNPRLAFVKVLAVFEPKEAPAAGVHERAFVAGGAVVDPTASVGPFAYVGSGARIAARAVLHPFSHVGADCEVGEGSVLHAGATLYPRCRIGRNVVLHAGAVLGGDGFGYVPDGTRLAKIPQLGIVEVGDDAEIGANTAVDRATLGKTSIGRGSKIDNLVQIGHNVRVGEDNAISALTGISGSTSTGRNVTMAGQVGTQSHIHIGDGVLAIGQTGITKDIPAGSQIAGYSLPLPQWRRAEAIYRRLPDMKKAVDALEKRVGELEAARRRPTTARARPPKSRRPRKRPSGRGRRS